MNKYTEGQVTPSAGGVVKQLPWGDTAWDETSAQSTGAYCLTVHSPFCISVVHKMRDHKEYGPWNNTCHTESTQSVAAVTVGTALTVELNTKPDSPTVSDPSSPEA